MFVVIETREERRRPPKSGWIYKDPVLKDYDKSDPDPWKYELTGEKIPRDPKWKLVVKLRHTYRQDGKVKGKSVKIITVSFWDFIESWLDYRIQDYESYEFYVPEKRVYSAFDNLVEATGAQGDAEFILMELAEKLKPWQETALAEYKQCEEFTYAQGHIDGWKEVIRLRMEAHMKDWEERERKRKADEEFRKDHSRYRKESFGQGVGSLSLSDDEQRIFKRIWKIGYRTMSMELHPDKGGDPEQMKILNGLKDKLGK